MNTWEQTSFTASEIHENIETKKFVVPQYQRGTVWSNRQKDQFVDTLKRGLPFGSILLYHDEDKNIYQIIDGLQRSTTIYEFITHPAQYFNEDDIDSDLPERLIGIAGLAYTGTLEKEIRDHMINWVKDSFSTMDDVKDLQYGEYSDAFLEHWPSAEENKKQVTKVVKPSLLRFKKLCENLCSVKIPAIIIKGEDDYLPEIFERINSKGTQLSKYQIYAATWTKKYVVDDAELEDLIQYNIRHYESMASDGTEIADFEVTSFAHKKELNLFEICYGLGKKLGHEYPSLFDPKKEPKEVDSLGFTLIAACINVKNSKTKNMHTDFDKVIGSDLVNQFLKRVIQCVGTVQKLIGKYNKFKVNAKDEVGPLHTEFQIVSLIANIFVARYAQYQRDEKDRIIQYTVSLDHSNEEYSEYEKAAKENAWKRYCVDILNSRWKGAGDKKMDSVIFDREYYTQNMDWSGFEANLWQWHQVSKSEKREYKRVAPPKEPEKMFLSMVYLGVFTAEDQADQSRYDVEHLATKNLMRKCMDRYSGQLHLPIGSIGNLCLLPQMENRAKKDRTIYEDNAFLQKSHYALSELEDKFTFTRKSDMDWLADDSLTQEEFKERYIRYLDNRFAIMLSKIKAHYFH